MNEDLARIWMESLNIMQSELNDITLDLWLRPTVPVALERDTLVVEAATEFARDWVQLRYSDVVRRAVKRVAGERFDVRFIAPAQRRQTATAAVFPAPAQQPSRTSAPPAAHHTIQPMPLRRKPGAQLPPLPVSGSSALSPGIRTLPAQSLPQQSTEHADSYPAIPSPPAPEEQPPATPSAAPVVRRLALASDEIPVGQLNPRYTFASFVIGNSNRFAHAAALAVAEAPARAYNPLFIYGGVGLGKTHLMHAIGHHALAVNRGLRVVYVSSETFTNELINAIRDDTTVEFRNKYRNIDVLLMDDIQFVAGKERTQEEFFHTFNALYEANKQIVISSDRPPKEIPTLEDRLRSRFEWGLITDIQAPDFETRIAILRKKANAENLQLPDDLLVTIARQIHSNIRELEGALIRVIAYSSLTNSPLTPDLASEVLHDLASHSKQRQITIELIQEVVAEHFGLRVPDLKARKRTRSLAFPRQVAMYLCRELTDASLPRIGEAFGGRDHTTVIHAYERIQEDLKNDASFAETMSRIVRRLQSPG